MVGILGTSNKCQAILQCDLDSFKLQDSRIVKAQFIWAYDFYEIMVEKSFMIPVKLPIKHSKKAAFMTEGIKQFLKGLDGV